MISDKEKKEIAEMAGRASQHGIISKPELLKLMDGFKNVISIGHVILPRV